MNINDTPLNIKNTKELLDPNGSKLYIERIPAKRTRGLHDARELRV